jgi:hypothetical protein
MPIKKNSPKGMIGKQHKLAANAPEEKAAKGAELVKPSAAKKLEFSKLVTAKLSTAKLLTLKKLSG